jgi:hypothetical protein
LRSLLLAVLKLEETVKQFLLDASQTTLEFPPSTSNFEVILVTVAS